jgi:hypothetical protein
MDNFVQEMLQNSPAALRIKTLWEVGSVSGICVPDVGSYFVIGI